MNTHTVIVTNDYLWELNELYSFLIKNTHKKIRLILNPEAACLRSIGLYDILDQFEFESVEIHTKNLLETHNKYKIVVNEPFIFFEKIGTPITRLHNWSKEKLFMCLYGRPTANRLGILSYLNSNYPEDSCLSCAGNIGTEDTRLLFELEKLFGYRSESLIEFGSLINKFPLRLDPNSRYFYNVPVYDDPAVEFYNDILIDIISETFTSGESFFPTEKTARAILFKKPFLIFGTKNFLIYLRQMGFKTFYEYWDEDYDGFEKKTRFTMILSIIDALAKKSRSELYDMYRDMQHILDHNYNLLVSHRYNKEITLIND